MFQLSENEVQAFSDWKREHDETCVYANPNSVGAIGGRFTYCFTPTGSGTTVVVKCACGEELNVTDVSDW